MLSRRSLTLGVAYAALIAPAYAGDASATAFITAIYDSYKGKGAKGTPLDSERTIRRYFEPKLAAWMARDQKAAARRNEVGALDFDPFLDAQEWDVTRFDIVVSDAAAGKAQATVKFVNLAQLESRHLDQMCQVSMSELSLVYPRFDLGIEFVERALEPAVDSAQTGKRGSGSRSQ